MKHQAAPFGLSLATSFALFVGPSPIPRSIMRGALHIMRFLGLFRLARHLTRGGLRIICYHGLAVSGEYQFRSTLFIQSELFRKLIDYLKRHNYPILPLCGALDALYADRLPPGATVIAMDDGWRGVYTIGSPMIRELQIPVTVYVATASSPDGTTATRRALRCGASLTADASLTSNSPPK